MTTELPLKKYPFALTPEQQRQLEREDAETALRIVKQWEREAQEKQAAEAAQATGEPAQPPRRRVDILTRNKRERRLKRDYEEAVERKRYLGREYQQQTIKERDVIEKMVSLGMIVDADTREVLGQEKPEAAPAEAPAPSTEATDAP